MKQSRWLKQTLILSVAVNVLLVTLFFYLTFRKTALHFPYPPEEVVKTVKPPLSLASLDRVQGANFEHLVGLLGDKRKAYEGYTVRDFALGALVTRYAFDLGGALEGHQSAPLRWVEGEREFVIYPSLPDEAYNKIATFALSRKWPFTARGLYSLIKEQGIDKSEKELLEAFCHTTEFRVVSTLFGRAGSFSKGTLLALCLEAGWEEIDRLHASLKERGDFSPEIRSCFLRKGVEKGSSTAAYVLVLTDKTFIERHLTDEEVIHLLELMPIKTAEALAFAREITHSPRGERVKKIGQERLAFYTGAPVEEVAAKFYQPPVAKELRPVFRDTPPPSLPSHLHVIQEGESLWLIARRYKVSVEALMELNHLSSSVLQPGKTLNIPQ